MRIKDSRLYLSVMSRKCYCYTKPLIRLGGFRTRVIALKELCLNHSTTNPFSPVQVSHLLPLITKQLHYFYANQA
jgi:hypothetical protein